MTTRPFGVDALLAEGAAAIEHARELCRGARVTRARSLGRDGQVEIVTRMIADRALCASCLSIATDLPLGQVDSALRAVELLHVTETEECCAQCLTATGVYRVG